MSGRVDLKLRSRFKFVSRPSMENTFAKVLDTFLNSAIALFKNTRTENALLIHYPAYSLKPIDVWRSKVKRLNTQYSILKLKLKTSNNHTSRNSFVSSVINQYKTSSNSVVAIFINHQWACCANTDSGNIIHL